MDYYKITDVHAREILDSRGNPTVEAEVTVDYKFKGRASVPSGASTGMYEAVELRDGDAKCDCDGPCECDNRYYGKGVLQAVKNVNTEIKKCILEKNVLEQALIDKMMCKLDGTENKSRLGANAILAVSMACAKAAANALGVPLYTYLGGAKSHKMPVPMMNILNGGVHARNKVDFQEFMIMPVGADTFAEGLRMGTEVYHALKKILESEKKVTAVGDEGGFAPDLKDAFEVFDYLVKAVKKAGYEPGKDVCFAMDAASSELYQFDTGKYFFPSEGENGVMRSSEEMIELYEQLCERYPLKSIEDGLDEEDWKGWKELTRRLGDKVQLVGDDLFVTNSSRLKKGISSGCGNAILVKVNQIGTITESIEAVQMAKENGYRCILSHRSGETEDTTIADLAVALDAGQIKTGAPCRTDRTAKYNQLIRIEEQLHYSADYINPFIKM